MSNQNNQATIMEKFGKMKAVLRSELRGMARANPAYQVAIDAFNFAEKRIIGFRKDGITPNFMHAMEVLAYVMTLPGLRYPAETYAAAILHDVLEDTATTRQELQDSFGNRVTVAVVKLSKVIEGSKVMHLEHYFDGMVEDEIASIVKGADRGSNQGAMDGVFGIQKQIEQLEETERFILPMIKLARDLHADQYHAYMNIKLLLTTQIKLFRSIHRALSTNA